MTFQEILPKFLEGKKNRRSCWYAPEGYIYIKNGELYNEKDIRICPEDFYFDVEEFMANDWEIYKEEHKEYFDWSKAYELMKQGKKILRKGLEPKDMEKCYIFLDDGVFMGGINRTHWFYNLKQDDLEAKDWYLVEEE